MQTFADISAARLGIMVFFRDHSSEVPEHLAARFNELTVSPSPVDQIVGVGEFIYANRDQLPAPALDLGGGLIAFASTNAWHGLAEDARGDKIVKVLRHEMGELATAPSEANTPEPKAGQRIDPPGEAPEPAEA